MTTSWVKQVCFKPNYKPNYQCLNSGNLQDITQWIDIVQNRLFFCCSRSYVNVLFMNVRSKGLTYKVSHITFKPHHMIKYEVTMATMNSSCYFSITKHGNDALIVTSSQHPVSSGGPSSVPVQYSYAMNTQSTCGIHSVITCLCQRRGGTLAIFMSLCLCQWSDYIHIKTLEL